MTGPRFEVLVAAVLILAGLTLVLQVAALVWVVWLR